jgi:colanic acid/amylovoran biosynthesis glycosyltransferase
MRCFKIYCPLLVTLIFMVWARPAYSTSQQQRPVKPLKILMIVPSFPVFKQVYIIHQINGLLDRGHDVRILALNRRGSKITTAPELQKHSLLSRVYYDRSNLRLDKFDVIISQFAAAASQVLLMLPERKAIKTKLVTFFRGELSISKAGGFSNRIFENFDRLVPVCDFLKRVLVEHGCPAEKISVIRSMTDIKKFAFKHWSPPHDGMMKIVSVGRLTEKKGFDYAIQAVAALHKQYPNITYTIVGGGSYQAKLIALIQELNAQSYITLQGEVPYDQVAEYLRGSHIFLLPSVTSSMNAVEGIPNVVREAMAIGLPVVSTQHAGIGELVADGVEGWLVAERDVNGLVDRLARLIKSPDLCMRMGAAGRKKVEDCFDTEKEHDALERLLHNLVASQ